MPIDYANQVPTTMRRNDRAVNDEEWIKGFLKHVAVGTMATVHQDQPFLNSNLFVYDADNHCIYMHTAHVGRTQANIALNNKVCFTVMEMGRLLPAEAALNFSVEYESVVVFGRAMLVDNGAEAKQALQMLLDKYAPHLKPITDYHPPTDEELKVTAVFRIEVDDWTGKRKAAAEDFPGAFWYAEIT